MNIDVLTPTTGPIDESPHGIVRGLPPGPYVTFRAQMRDPRDLLRTSHLTLTAGNDGVATVAFLLESPGPSSPIDGATTAETWACR